MDRDLQKKFSNDIKEASGGGVDMIYDLVGGDYAEPSLRAIKRHGKYLVIGFTAGIPKMPLNLTLLKECQIIGVFWGQFAGMEPELNAQNFKELFAMHAEGKIKPFISQSFSLEDTTKAIKSLEDRKVLGKVVVSME
jgi:NADPH2:quinone reductase